MELLEIYERLLEAFGRQDWWPVRYSFSPKEWEICLGAILTQNTNWNNVEKALFNLRNKGVSTLKDLLKIKTSDLEKLVRPSGFYRQKAKRLKDFARFVSRFGGVKNFLKNFERKQILKVKGIGKETADSLLLYAGNRPHFVVDAYTKRIFSRLGLIREDWNYEEIKGFFEKNLEKNTDLYKEFHALIVRLGKEYCQKDPKCSGCPLRKFCTRCLKIG
jgi:endonuclease-3 related protein